MPRQISWKLSDSGDSSNHCAINTGESTGENDMSGVAEAKLANGLSEAMNSPMGGSNARTAPENNKYSEHQHLAELGALPPADEADDEKSVDVMSEPPEIDTSRADTPPLFSYRMKNCVKQTLLYFFLLMIFSAVVVATVLSVGMYNRDCEPDLLLTANSTRELARRACSTAKELVTKVESEFGRQ
jgi:hypothetical protein